MVCQSLKCSGFWAEHRKHSTIQLIISSKLKLLYKNTLSHKYPFFIEK